MTDPTPVRPEVVVGLAVAAAAVTYVLLRLWVDGGHGYPHPSWLELVTLVLIGTTALVLGRRVRRMARGLDGARVSPLTAARTFVLAQAAAVTGAVLAGAHTGGALALVPVASATGAWGGLARTVVLAVVSAALAVVGLVVQGWCRRPPEAPDGPGHGDAPA